MPVDSTKWPYPLSDISAHSSARELAPHRHNMHSLHHKSYSMSTQQCENSLDVEEQVPLQFFKLVGRVLPATVNATSLLLFRQVDVFRDSIKLLSRSIFVGRDSTLNSAGANQEVYRILLESVKSI